MDTVKRRNPDERFRELERAWANDGSVEAARAYLSALKRSSKMASRMVDRLDSLWDVDWGQPPRGLVELIWLVGAGRMETDHHEGLQSRVGAVIVPGDGPLGTTLFHANVGRAPLCLQCARTESGWPDYADRHVCGRWGEFEGEPLVHLGARTHIAHPIPGASQHAAGPYQSTQGAISGGTSTTNAVPQRVAVLWSRAHGGGEARRNPDEGQRRLERAAAAGDLEAQARHLVGLIRRGGVRADHVQSLAALGDGIAKLAVGKPASTEGLQRLVFTETDLVREWGPVWAVIAATSFLEVLDPELEGGGGGGLERLALSGREWVAGRRRCNLREHSGPPIDTCFWGHASEWANDLAAVDTPSWVRYCGLAGTNYMLLVDSADSAVRGEPPRLYRGYAKAPDTFAYDLFPVWSHSANALSLKAAGARHGHNYDQALRQRAIDNLRPWIMAGSPDVWDMGGATLAIRQNPKDRPRKPIEVCCHMCHAAPGQRCRWAPGPEGFHCRRIQHAENADRRCDCVTWPREGSS